MQMRVVLKIYGRVQGVFFRAFVKDRADELELAGWVRNEDDGSVTVLAQGPEDDLKKLVEACKEGQKFAKISNVEVKWEEANGEYKGFVIR